MWLTMGQTHALVQLWIILLPQNFRQGDKKINFKNELLNQKLRVLLN